MLWVVRLSVRLSVYLERWYILSKCLSGSAGEISEFFFTKLSDSRMNDAH